ncbi:MAG TPA: prolyl oligopeptidase family serine peptidase [Terriglobia bacterium]|nr:prolyl oligopeptidase family serine peptidase [Terriglobia bacterium]
MRSKLLVMAILAGALVLHAQTRPNDLKPILDREIQPVPVVAFQLSQYLAARIPKLPSPTSAQAWTSEEKRWREHILNDIAFHGWPREWVEAAPKFEDLGAVETGQGYRWRKLRYEIVPGFHSTAILYEPEHMTGKAPAILNVNGHDPLGNAAEYKQKRCINFAKRGIVALSLEWMNCGELYLPENAHDFGAHLDLVGANELGLFYLAMRRGVDYLATLPQVDPARLGVTGLSGGGWQTIVLSALDERIKVAVEVAGFGSLESNITHPVDTDEIEEDPTDFDAGFDYTILTALRAPRPTLLIHNAEDDCCFRADLVKPYIYDGIQPFFRLYRAEAAFGWHENRDPGTHNYQIDNREAAYTFFTTHFNLPVATKEIPSEAEIKSHDELVVGLPKDNLTILGLARKMATAIHRESVPADSAARGTWAAAERSKLESDVRYKPAKVATAWRMWNTKNKGLETISYRFDFENRLNAAGVWLKALAAPADAPATLVLNDKGRKEAAEVVSDRVNRGEQVLALDPLFVGETIPQKPDPTDWELLTATTGDRPLGIEAAQVIAAAKWLREISGQHPVRLETTGIRSEVIGLVAAALEPTLFSEQVSRQAMSTLGFLLDAPVIFRAAPELFCLDLYKDFDIDLLIALAAPTKVNLRDYAKPEQFKPPEPEP